MAHAGGSARLDAILIAGATASGKSALALRLAERFRARIVNTDSMQVYRDLRILTARPSDADMRRAPHRLFGTVDGAEAFSVTSWLAAAAVELDEARSADVLPIFVGGTGLYFKALTQGLSAVPDIPADIRTEVRAWAAARPAEELYRALASRDPLTAARLRPTDPQRLLRALEVHAATGESLAGLQGRRSQPLLDVSACSAIMLDVDRDVLRERVDTRFDAMILGGALDEVKRLADRRLGPALPVMRAIGVPSLIRHLAGESGAEAASAEAKASSRRYIKRQETFFRHQLPAFRPMTAEAADELVASYS